MALYAENILFDLDGTLTDPKEGITRSVQYALSKLGIYADTEELVRFIGPPLVESFATFFSLSPSDCELAVKYYRERFSQVGIFENAVLDGIPEMLEKLVSAGAALALATSKPLVFAERILERYSLSRFFSVTVGSGLDGSLTDKAEVISAALERMEINDPSTAAMVGDRKHDIIGAKKNSIRSVGVYFGYVEPGELEASGADRIACTVPQLAKILLEG